MITTIAETSWYILNVKPKLFKKVLETLQKRNIENYCPHIPSSKYPNDRRKNIMEPLFSSYIFVKIDFTAQSSSVAKISGIFNFVYWLSEPVKIKNEEIDSIRSFLNRYDVVDLEKSKVNIGAEVRITNGSLMRRDGKIVQVTGFVVKMELPSLGYTINAKVNRESAVIDVAVSQQSVLYPDGTTLKRVAGA